MNTTYMQRTYWKDDFFKTGSKNIFLYICGESTCNAPESARFWTEVGNLNNAMLYIAEHRYYGESQPRPDWSTPNLKYLSAEQALADLANFVQAKNDELNLKYGYNDWQWVVVGGSYPGALSAWFKFKYPHLVKISWASSGVVHAIKDFTKFDY